MELPSPDVLGTCVHVSRAGSNEEVHVGFPVERLLRLGFPGVLLVLQLIRFGLLLIVVRYESIPASSPRYAKCWSRSPCTSGSCSLVVEKRMPAVRSSKTAIPVTIAKAA